MIVSGSNPKHPTASGAMEILKSTQIMCLSLGLQCPVSDQLFTAESVLTNYSSVFNYTK